MSNNPEFDEWIAKRGKSRAPIKDQVQQAFDAGYEVGFIQGQKDSQDEIKALLLEIEAVERRDCWQSWRTWTLWDKND